MTMETIGLYIHIPFCRHKCIYCGFYSVSCGVDLSNVDRYLDCLEMECVLREKQYGRLYVDTVFVGGGTPSILSPRQLDRLGHIIHSHFDLANVTEFTFESNPGTLDPYKLDSMRAMGANRLSMGLQSSDDRLLVSLGRIHNRVTFEQSYHMARQAGFDNISVDMMFGLPGQTVNSVERDIDYIMELSPEHISAYSLMIDPGTPLEQMLSHGTLTLPEEDDERQMYYTYRRRLAQAGYIQYEISNWSRPGRRSAHNVRYWRDQDYLGLGPAAHSLMQEYRLGNPESLETWSESLTAGGDPAVVQEKRSLSDHMSEYMFTGLRMLEGIEFDSFRETFGCSLDEVYPGVVDKLVTRGLISRDQVGIRLTDLGLDLGNQVFVEFV